MAAIAEEPRLMPHLHLSLQAGDDMILKRMKRRHCRADAITFCAEVRAPAARHRLRRRPHRGLSDRDRGRCSPTPCALVDECGLTYLHVFPFSPRPGTPAARMPQVAGPAVKERAARLRAAGEAALAAHPRRQVGSDVELLMERDGARAHAAVCRSALDRLRCRAGCAGRGPRHGATGQRLQRRAARRPRVRA